MRKKYLVCPFSLSFPIAFKTAAAINVPLGPPFFKKKKKKKKTPAVQAIIRGTQNSLENLLETERMKQ